VSRQDGLLQVPISEGISSIALGFSVDLKNPLGLALAHAHKSNGKSISFAVAWKVELILATIAYD